MAPIDVLAPNRFIRAAAEAPNVAGAYVLLLTLSNPLDVALPGRPTVTLPPGRLLYVGSARGPGGLRARLARHMRLDKRLHWHIDRLTAAATVEGAWVLPDGDECGIVDALGNLPAPVPGFGASDCRRHISHLLGWS